MPHSIAERRASATMATAMTHLTRREFLTTATSATLTTLAAPELSPGCRLCDWHALCASSSAPAHPTGFSPTTGIPRPQSLTPAGVAAKVPKVAWLAFSHGHDFVYSASELESFEGKPTGEVASFRLVDGELQPLSARNSAGTGTCHVAVDHSGRMLLAADYTGASAASFRIEDGKLSEPVWTEHYTEHGPNPVRQPTAHAHFVVVLARQSFCLHQ